MEQEQIIDDLLAEYVEHKNAIKSMISDLERIRVKIDTLLPETVDKRFKYYFEEKVKAITALFNSLLDMRKEIAKSVKDEIEIRRRMVKGDTLEDLEELLDVRKIAKKVQIFKNENEKVKKQIEVQKKPTVPEDRPPKPKPSGIRKIKEGKEKPEAPKDRIIKEGNQPDEL